MRSYCFGHIALFRIFNKTFRRSVSGKMSRMKSIKRFIRPEAGAFFGKRSSMTIWCACAAKLGSPELGRGAWKSRSTAG
jgi:hypothetical protein